jgi:TolA-binding protein
LVGLQVFISSLFFLRMEDYHGAIKNLNTMKRAAMRYGLKELHGDALLALAKNNLKLGESDNAGVLLAEAIKIFNEINQLSKLNQTRGLMAMAKGESFRIS